jgi:C-terminal processing protease CtpA/Prc
VRAGLVAILMMLAACVADRGTIGAVLGQKDDGRLFVREVPEGLAADVAGLDPGDEILLIDGKDVRALGPKGVHQALSGEVGQPVKLTVIRGEEVLRISVKRTPARKRLPTAPAPD